MSDNNRKESFCTFDGQTVKKEEIIKIDGKMMAEINGEMQEVVSFVDETLTLEENKGIQKALNDIEGEVGEEF